MAKFKYILCLLKRSVLFTCIFVSNFGFSTPSFAMDSDKQIWGSVTTIATLSPTVSMAVEGHLRFTEDAGTLGQKFLRPSITYKLNDNVSLSAGYLYGIFNSSTSTSFEEQRTWQQVGYIFFKKPSGISLSARTRIEERFVERQNDTGWRLRQQLRFETPLVDSFTPKVLVWNETFIGLNDTRWGQRSDIDQTRTFVGFSIPVNDKINIEPGYLNQAVFRAGENRLNHVAAMNVIVKF
jgi:hypothetical protein